MERIVSGVDTWSVIMNLLMLCGLWSSGACSHFKVINVISMAYAVVAEGSSFIGKSSAEGISIIEVIRTVSILIG